MSDSKGDRHPAREPSRQARAPLLVGCLLVTLGSCRDPGDPEIGPISGIPSILSVGAGTEGAMNGYAISTIFTDIDGDGVLECLDHNGPLGIEAVELAGPQRFERRTISVVGTHASLAATSSSILTTLELPGDQLPDLLIEVPQGGVLLRNLGNLAFDAVSFYTEPGVGVQQPSYPPWSFTSADLDGDGYREAVGTAGGHGLVAIGRQDPSVAAGMVSLGVGPSYGTVEVIDADRDGAPEIYICAYAETIIYERDNASGTYSVAQTLSRLRSPLSFDVDQDGQGDLLGTWGSAIVCSFRTGSRWSTPIPIRHGAANTYGFGAPRIVLADLNSSGRTDLILPERSQVEIGFTLDPRPLQDVAHLFGQVFVLDLESDGRCEVVCNDGQRLFLYQGGPGASEIFQVSRQFVANGTILRALPVRSGTTGKDRVLITTLRAWAIHVSVVEFQGKRGRVIQEFQPPGSSGPLAIAAFVDVDGDEDGDLIYSTPEGTVRWIPGGDGADPTPQPVMLSATNEFPTVGDVDDDGDQDVIFPFGGTISINDGSGGFTSISGPNFSSYYLFFPAPRDNTSDLVADQNGDGIVDVFVAVPRGESPGLIAFGIGGEPPMFTNVVPVAPILEPDRFVSWTPLDVDQDGVTDFVDAWRGKWRRRGASGLIDGGIWDLPQEFRLSQLTVGDFDANGRPDDFILNRGVRARFWRVDSIEGFVGLSAPGTVFVLGQQLLSGDFDGDGVVDLCEVLASSLVLRTTILTHP